MPKIRSSKPSNKREDAGFFSKWTYWYIQPILKQGLSNRLHLDDYPEIEKQDEAKYLSSKLLSGWQHELKRNGDKAKLYMVFLKQFGVPFSIAGFIFLLRALVRVAQAVILSDFITWFSTPDASYDDAYLLGSLLSLSVIFNTCFAHVDFFLIMRAGLQFRIALQTTVFEKMLRLPNSHFVSTGFLVNLMSNDVQRFEDMAPNAHYLWIGPIECILSAYYMYVLIGFSAFIAIGTLLLMIPLQSFFATLFAKFRRESVVVEDERIKSLSDLFSGIELVKLYAWEIPFKNVITKLYKKEISWVRKSAVITAYNESIYFSSSAVISGLAFIPVYFIKGSFTAASVFSTMTLLANVRMTMTNRFPKALQFSSEATVSLDRIQKFLLLDQIDSARAQLSNISDDEIDSVTDKRVEREDILVLMKAVSFRWSLLTDSVFYNNFKMEQGQAGSLEEKDILKDISLYIKRGELLGICGAVGSGKSSVAQAIMGEMNGYGAINVINGDVKISYLSQTPWLFSGTVKENILFGIEFNAEWFQQVIGLCALETDMNSLSDGIDTVVGEKGVSLSGGQKSRIALARAIYFDADLYLLDDPLSAVDVSVGRQLFHSCIKNLTLNKRTTHGLPAVAFISHNLHYIRECDRILLFENGEIVKSGLPNDVLEDLPQQELIEIAKEPISRRNSVSTWSSAYGIDKEIKRCSSLKNVYVTEHGVIEYPVVDGMESTLDDNLDEENEKRGHDEELYAYGSISRSTYLKYFTIGSSKTVFALLMISFIVGQASWIAADLWLALWSGNNASDQGRLFLWVFVGIIIFTVLISIARSVLYFQICLNTCEVLFGNVLTGTIKSPMSFFERTPHGRLMNRFAKDMNYIEELLPATLFDFIQSLFILMGALVVSLIFLPHILIGLPVVLVIFYYIRLYYVTTSRQIKRLEAVTRSPIYSNVPNTLEGLAVIRTFRATDRFLNEFINVINTNTRMNFAFLSAGRWVGLRLDFLAALFLNTIICAGVYLKANGEQQGIRISGGVIGMVLSYGLMLLGLLQWAVRQSAEVENMMVSVERILEYCKLPTEKQTYSQTPPEDWPSSGDIKITNLTLTYPSQSRPALKNVSVHFKAGQRIGIVGRTGAGKSSMISALFRLVEPSKSSLIIIDGIDTSTLKLQDLRKSITIIPQTPICFKGSVRFNLDPFNEYSDTKIWSVLNTIQVLKDKINENGKTIDFLLSEGGSNWSIGELQLLCLARAILRQSKIIIMDEATASIDEGTDWEVQRIIRDGCFFNESTVLTISHRLESVADYDMVLVLENSKVVEYDNPYVMLTKDLSDPSAWLRKMSASLGDEAFDRLKDKARNSLK